MTKVFFAKRNKEGDVDMNKVIDFEEAKRETEADINARHLVRQNAMIKSYGMYLEEKELPDTIENYENFLDIYDYEKMERTDWQLVKGSDVSFFGDWLNDHQLTLEDDADDYVIVNHIPMTIKSFVNMVYGVDEDDTKVYINKIEDKLKIMCSIATFYVEIM